MTVASALNRKSYAGNGSTTEFSMSPVTFFETSDLEVYIVVTATGAATLLVENTDYEVTTPVPFDGTGIVDTSLGSDPYGAPSASETIVIVRNLPLTQETDFVQNDGSDAEVTEDALDRLTMLTQQLSARIDRSVYLADSDVTGADPALPTPEASKLLGWDSAGLALINYSTGELSAEIPVSSFGETLIDDADAAAARTTLGVPSNTEAILDTIFDAAGDLIYATAADTPARLALGTARQVLQVNAGATAPAWAAPITLTAEQATTSGTAIDVTGIPAGVKRITINFDGVSTTVSSAPYLIQLGDAGGIENTGYVSRVNTTASGNDSATDGFILMDTAPANGAHIGTVTLTLTDATNNTWIATGIITTADPLVSVSSGSKSLSAVLTQLRLTTVGAAGTFDAGSISVLYE